MDFKDWKWLNESRMTEANGELAIAAPAKTDWFNNPVPEDGTVQPPVGESVKVGLEAQSPAGEGGLRIFSDVSLENRTVINLRKGL